MIDLPEYSDGDISSEIQNSSNSSSSMSSSSFSRLSFDAGAITKTATSPTPKDFIHMTSSKPHRSSEPAWAAIRAQRGGLPLGLGPKDFKLVRRIGTGDIGTVYLCRLRETSSRCAYAMKVVDKLAVGKKGKLGRAETERRILRTLDHPFLPILYAEFDASPNFSFVVMEYCSGGDLHSLRHRQPGHRFSLHATRFYAAEVLLALEYLHLLGIVYRDLKPENILIRSDGHIMLSDFDLSLESTAFPTVQHVNQLLPAVVKDNYDFTGTDPSCLPYHLFRHKNSQTLAERRFVAEPVEAKSCSFVGTHEYVAPEVASGRAHGSAVDWWAYGVFLYELIYGRTPFAGPTNEATLRNIVKQPLSFPAMPPVSSAARGLIAALLIKDPSERLGSRNGAADVKSHKFFKGLNFALLRSCRPPVIPGLKRSASCHERTKPAQFEYF